jgi:hypothetical protein
MKLFQIEEPDGAPLAGDGPGAAVGIALSPPAAAVVAIAVGGNAQILPGHDGEATPVVAVRGSDGAWDGDALGALLLALRGRAEKALARPVTHAVIALVAPDATLATSLAAAAQSAGLALLRVMDASSAASLARGDGIDAAALGAAMQAEDDAAALTSRGA